MTSDGDNQIIVVDDHFKSLLISHKDPLDIIRKCMPDLVRKLDLEPVMDYVIAGDLLSEDKIDEYEQKKEEMNGQRQQVNRWFLRRIVLKENIQFSQQLIMAVHNTQHEVQDHSELVKLLKEKLLASESMEIKQCSQSSYTQSTTNHQVQSITDPQTTDRQVQSITSPLIQSTADHQVQSTSTTDPQVQSTIDHQVQSTTDHQVQPTTDHQVQSTTDHQVQSTTDHQVQSTTEHQVQSTTAHQVQSTTDPQVPFTPDRQVPFTPDHQVQSTIDHQVQSTTDHQVQSTTDHQVQSTTDHQVQSTTDHQVQSTTYHQVQSTTDHQVQSTTDHQVQSTTDHQAQSTTDHQVPFTPDYLVQSTTDHQVQSTTDHQVQSTTDHQVPFTPDHQVQSTTDHQVPSTTDHQVQSSTDHQIQSTVDPQVQSTIDSQVQSAVDSQAQSTTDLSVQSTIDPSAQYTTDPQVQSTTDVSVQSTINPSVESTTDPQIQSIVDPQVQSAIESLVPLDHVTNKSPKPFTFVMPKGKELREYQRELAATGMKGVNYVVCAPTGTGKTLIASMVVADHLTKRPDGKILFLVNKVPLAEQQCQEVKQYIPDLQAQFITGDSGIQISLFQLLHDNNMVVCTDGVFLNELRTSALSSAERLSLNDITLLIIDECHNAKKNSPYAMIMEQYVKMKVSGGNCPNTKPCLPQIMGLTASPGAGDNPQGEVDKTLEHLLNLCALLDAQGGIRVVKENAVELVHFSNQPDFDLIKTNQRPVSDGFLQLLHNTMKSLESWVKQNFEVSCPHSRQHQAYENWVVSQRQQSELRYGPQERDLRVALNHLQCYYNSLKMYHELNQNDAIAVLKEKIIRTPQGKATQTELKFQQIFNNFIDQAGSIANIENPMLVRLRQLLEKQFRELPTTRGIVFATTKETAQNMCCWLQEIPQLKGVIKPDVVTGQSKEEMGGMTQQKQRNAIEQFRDGNINLLVATTVLEEGLDVAACNLVVRYNHVTNEIARVQAQGRARAKDSRCYAIMVMDSPKILQEQLNKEKGDLTLEAMEFLPTEGDKLSKEISTRQQQLLKDRQRQEQLQKELKTQDGCQVELLCKGCDSFICKLSDVRVVAESHHVVTDDKINERCIKRGPSTPIPKGEIELGKKVFCAQCEREWGVMMKWPHNGMHYPAIKCKFVLFRHPTGEKQYYKQWKTIPFTITKYE